MKKLNLKLEGVKQMLTREQMKKVVGGYDGGSGCPPSDCYNCLPGETCHQVLCHPGGQDISTYLTCY